MRPFVTKHAEERGPFCNGDRHLGVSLHMEASILTPHLEKYEQSSSLETQTLDDFTIYFSRR